MANTETIFSQGYEISAMDSDWAPGKFLSLHSIQFVPGATNDIMVIKDQTDAGATVFYAKSIDGDSRIKYFPDSTRIMPVIDYSACTLSAGAKVIVMLSRMN